MRIHAVNSWDRKMTPFIGREAELKILEGVSRKNSASLIVLKGRRRIGKSRLVQEFVKGQQFYSFTGLPPTSETTAQSEREAFAKQFKKAFNVSPENIDDWWELL
jgi:AAA+ ATPase superfamily predicted ATPase